MNITRETATEFVIKRGEQIKKDLACPFWMKMPPSMSLWSF